MGSALVGWPSYPRRNMVAKRKVLKQSDGRYCESSAPTLDQLKGGEMSILRSLFSAKEVRDVAYAISSLNDGPLGNNLSFSEIAQAAIDALYSNAETVKRQVIVDGLPPLHVALNLIVNLCGRDLGSGHFHTYRGVLSGRGTARKALFHEAQRMMVERGFIQQDDADVGAERLREEIATAG
ncbi:hypothetical protein [Novosphingobium olei]|uniref:Uncharacterized protein n=1 Tax=Novosphingobium olei TaxID=2728851 RepID=A0A7Y0GBA3_9SPHN|nr:hypothetical protein [Novosphingobium olei]NML94973.1 hypothetical protein [Novosphingobium olei]